MNLKDYPYFAIEGVKDIIEQLRQITNIRKDDITQFQNLPNIFLSGRTVGKIPATSNDVDPTDNIGDQSYDASYLYILIDNAGTPEWRRASLGSF